MSTYPGVRLMQLYSTKPTNKKCLNPFVQPYFPQVQLTSTADDISATTLEIYDACTDALVETLTFVDYSDDTLFWKETGTGILGFGSYYGKIGNQYTEIVKVCNVENKIVFAQMCADLERGANLYQEVYFEDYEQLTPTTEKEITEQIDRFGYRKSTTGSTKIIEGIRFLGTVDTYRALLHLELYDSVTINGKEVYVTSVSQEGTGSVYAITVRYYEKVVSTSNCCGDGFEGSPFDECEDTTGTGNSNCVEATISINTSQLPILSVDINGGAGTPVINWFKNGSYLSTGNTTTSTGFGKYTAEVTFPNCPKVSDTFSYVNPCENFSITTSVVNKVISANATGNTEAVSYVVKDATGATVATALPYTATAGTYTIIATSGMCERQIPVTVTDSIVDATCDYGVEIAATGNVLSAVISNQPSGIVSYTWTREDKEGNVATVGNSSTITAATTGSYLYELTVEINTCIKIARKLWINESSQVIPNIVINVDACCDDNACECDFYIQCDQNKNVTITNATGCDGFTFTFKKYGQIVASGVGPHQLEEGIYEVTADNGTCQTTKTYEHDIPNAGDIGQIIITG